MTLYQLKVFVMVAGLKSFTESAHSLRVRQPSVSLLMQSLQRELDVRLFERLGHKVHLTRAGEELQRIAEEILAKAEGIRERMDEIKGLKKGKISIGGSGIATTLFLPVAIQSFKKECPGVEVNLTIHRSEILEKKLLEGEIDLAILSWLPRSPLLINELYIEDDVVVIAPPKHPLTKKRSVSLTLLAKEPLITYEKGTPVRNMVEKKFAEKGLLSVTALEVGLQMGSRDAIRGAVASGLGIGFLSRCHVASDVQAGRLKILRVPELNIKRTMYITVHKNQQSSPLVQAFIEFLRRYKGRSPVAGLK